MTLDPKAATLYQATQQGNYMIICTMLMRGGLLQTTINRAFEIAVRGRNLLCVKLLHKHQTHNDMAGLICCTVSHDIMMFLLMQHNQQAKYDSRWFGVLADYAITYDLPLFYALVGMGIDVGKLSLMLLKLVAQAAKYPRHWPPHERFWALLAAGADLSITDENGKTVGQLIVETFHLPTNVYTCQQFVEQRRATVKAKKQWHNLILTEYDLSGRTYTGTRLHILPRELLTWYILPYLGALSPLELANLEADHSQINLIPI